MSSGWTRCQNGLCGQVTPNLPRTIQRERVARGGALAIVRDISHSMWGVHSKWASSVILRLIELTRRTHMRLGYIEFNEREQSTLAPCFCSGDDMCLTQTACPDRLVEVSRGQGQRQPL